MNDLGKSLACIAMVAGFVVVEKYEREGKMMAVSLKAGDVRILLTQGDGAAGSDRAKGLGFSLMITTRGIVTGVKTNGFFIHA